MLLAAPLIWGENIMTLSILRHPRYPQVFKMQRPLETVQNLWTMKLLKSITEINVTVSYAQADNITHTKSNFDTFDVGTVYEILYCWRVPLSLLWLMPQLEDWSYKSPIFSLQNARYCSLKRDSPYILLRCVTVCCTSSCHFKRC